MRTPTAMPRHVPSHASSLHQTGLHRAARLRYRAGSIVLVLAAGILGGLALLRVTEDRSVDEIWRDLEIAPSTGETFSADLVVDLPDPARRYFLHAIEPGTPLAASVRLSQTGTIRIGDDWSPFSAEQILTTRGFVWKANSRVGPLPIVATDYYAGDQGRMRVAAVGLIPFVNASGSDLTRSAIGRLVIEHMWLPSAWLPRSGARIEPVDDERFRITVVVNNEATHSIVRVDRDGRMLENTVQRFGNQAPDGRYQYIPFGGVIDAEATFGGYTIPTRIRMGWWYGTDRYHEEFRFQISGASYT